MAYGHENIIPPKPGEVRNPKGRGKSKNRKTLLKKWLSLDMLVAKPGTEDATVEATVEDQVYLSLIAKAMNGDTTAIKMCLDIMYGLQTQKVNVKETKKTQEPATLTVPDQETINLLDKLRDKFKSNE